MDMLTPSGGWLHLNGVLAVVGAWLLIGCSGVLALRRLRFVATVLFPLGACFSVALMAIALRAAFAEPEVAVLPLGLPHLPFHLRLDGLSAFFLLLIGGVSAGVSTFAAGYFRQGEGTPPGSFASSITYSSPVSPWWSWPMIAYVFIGGLGNHGVLFLLFGPFACASSMLPCGVPSAVSALMVTLVLM